MLLTILNNCIGKYIADIRVRFKFFKRGIINIYLFYLLAQQAKFRFNHLKC